MFEISEMPAIAGFVLLTMQYVKKIPPFSRGEGKEMLPLMASVLGAILAVVYQIVFNGPPHEAAHFLTYAVQGFITGLTACGAFSFLKMHFYSILTFNKPQYILKAKKELNPMPMPIPNEIREKIIKHKENNETQSNIAKWLMISESTVTKVWARYKRTSSYEPSPRTQGRKPRVDFETMTKIEEKIKETPDITLAELIAEFNLGISESALSKRLKKLGYSYKKTNLPSKTGRHRSSKRT